MTCKTSLGMILSKIYTYSNKIFPKRHVVPKWKSKNWFHTSALEGTTFHLTSNETRLSRTIAKAVEGLKQWSLKTRNAWLDSLLRRTHTPLAAHVHRKVTKSCLNGNARPAFALVGITFTSASGIVSKEEESESLCWRIRESVLKLNWVSDDDHWIKVAKSVQPSVKSLSFGSFLGKGCNAAVYSACWIQETSQPKVFPMAIKIMFNYGVESNAQAIVRAMQKEIIPCQRNYLSSNLESLRVKFLPAHPYIVKMGCAFADEVVDLPGCHALYPEALPQRINSKGLGHNMSLYVIMKRYDCSLRQFLSEQKPDFRTRLLLFAQLLEALVHLKKYQVSHRDLKADNVLVDLAGGGDFPSLALTDFGCCLMGFHLPYHSEEVDLGGNTALMAPEISRMSPGTFKTLDYSKADLWAAGTLGYEIFGSNNPFYEGMLDSRTYTESTLPSFPPDLPQSIQHLLKLILSVDPKKRPSPEVAATVCQLLLWAPRTWFQPNCSISFSSTVIMEWILALTTKILLGAQFGSCRFLTESMLLVTFLSRIRLAEVKQAISFIIQCN